MNAGFAACRDRRFFGVDAERVIVRPAARLFVNLFDGDGGGDVPVPAAEPFRRFPDARTFRDAERDAAPVRQTELRAVVKTRRLGRRDQPLSQYFRFVFFHDPSSVGVQTRAGIPVATLS